MKAIIFAVVLVGLAGCRRIPYHTTTIFARGVHPESASATTETSSGATLIGGGTRLAGSVRGTAMTFSFPKKTGWAGGGRQFSGTSTNWVVRVDSIYAPARRVELIRKKSPVDTNNAKSVTIECPPGKVILCGGVNTVRTAEGIAVTGHTLLTEPGRPQRWFASAERVGSGSDGWGVEAFAICAARPDNYEVIQQSTPVNSDTSHSLTVDLPAGKLILGGGARIVGQTQGAAIGTSGPDFRTTPPHWSGSASEIEPHSSDWGLEVTLICGSF